MELAGFIAGKVAFGTFAFVIPILVCGPLHAILGYLAAMGIAGVVMATVFQLAHVVEPAAYPLPDVSTYEMAEAWAVHQAATTVDFAPRSKIQSWLFGGLNFQTEHHLFPHISHLHYPRLSRIVERACKRFEIPYNVHPSLFSAIASHFSAAPAPRPAGLIPPLVCPLIPLFSPITFAQAICTFLYHKEGEGDKDHEDVSGFEAFLGNIEIWNCPLSVNSSYLCD